MATFPAENDSHRSRRETLNFRSALVKMLCSISHKHQKFSGGGFDGVLSAVHRPAVKHCKFFVVVFRRHGFQVTDLRRLAKADALSAADSSAR
jgi:hypothetical protein